MRPGTLRRYLRLRLSREDGFTVIEGVIAALILVTAALGTFQLFDAGARNTFRAEESQVLNNRLQAEVEAIRELSYGQIALTSLPTTSSDPDDPRSRISGSQFFLGRDGSQPAGVVYNGATAPGGGTVANGQVDPGPTPFQAGDVSGEIHRFVAWTSDPTCPECGEGLLRRIVVAATIDQAPVSSERSYQEVQTDVVDPEATPDTNSAPPEDDPGTSTASFWLTDTTCNNPSRMPLTGNHLGHNTRGVCSQGLTTGTTRGAPDLMFIEGPQVGSGAPLLYDYATDSEPAQNAASDIGLLMPWASTDTCALQSTLNTLDVRKLLDGVLSVLTLPALPGAVDGVLDIPGSITNKHRRIHTWVSPPASGSGGVLSGRGTLELYSKTINGAVHPGEICAWMSIRQPVTIPVQACVLVCVSLGQTTIDVDLPLVNVGILGNGDCRSGTGLNLTHFSHQSNPWPASWAKVSVPMCFVAVNSSGAVVPAVLGPGARVSLSVMVKRGGTEPGQGLEVMYDTGGFESRLELETNEVIPF